METESRMAARGWGEGEMGVNYLMAIECPFEICGRRLMVKSVSTVYFFPLMLSCLDSFGVIQS